MYFSVKHGKNIYQIQLADDSTEIDLRNKLFNLTGVDSERQKILIPKHGMVQSREEKIFRDNEVNFKTSSMDSPIKIILIGTSIAEIENMEKSRMVAKENDERRRLVHKSLYTKAYNTSKVNSDYSKYTFGRLEILPGLDDSENALNMLQRLKDDEGIRNIMVKYKWFVPVLKEMDPASHTTYDHKTLGLNHNNGQAIELRLRTDWYKGFRDYKTVRATLCHELAHNVHSEHNGPFWELTKKLEKEVITLNPFGSQGHKLSNKKFYSSTDSYPVTQTSDKWISEKFKLSSNQSNIHNKNSHLQKSEDSDVSDASSNNALLKKLAQERMDRNKKS